MDDTDEGEGVAERLGGFLDATGFDDLPVEAVGAAERMIVDTVGVSLAAADEGAVRIAEATAAGSGSEARVVGTGAAGTARDAAFATGIAAHALDFDDQHDDMGGHPSAPVLAAALPAAEAAGASGRDLLAAFTLGVEVESALGAAVNPGHYERGWHPTSTLGVFGATAAAGHLLGLDADGFGRALGVAASSASGLKGNFGTMTKPYHVGAAARDGLEAARLADAGFTADPGVLDPGYAGFPDLYGGDPPPSFDGALDALGERWRIVDPGVSVKSYPCGGSNHAAVQCGLALHDAVDPDAVERVTITEHPQRLPHTDRPEPDSGLEGKFSVQYCTAAALLRGDVWFDDFTDAAVEGARDLLDRIEVRGDDSSPRWGASVSATTAGGETVSRAVEEPHGFAGDPLSREELEGKYLRCARRTLSGEGAEASLDRLNRLDGFESVAPVVDALVG